MAVVRFGAGALFGFIVYAVSVAETLLRLVLNPFLWERATAASALWMLAFLPLFVAGGVLADTLSLLALRWVRFVSIGAIFGALVWSYLNVTWPITARASAFAPPQASLAEAAITGAGLGALAGALLLAVMFVSRRLRGIQD